MATMLRETYQIAAKDYRCDAFAIITDDLYQADFDHWEMKQICESNGIIKKGSKYYKQVGVVDGQFYTFRALPEIRDICLNHDLLTDY